MKWTEYEITCLKEHYPDTNNIDLANDLCRSLAAIEGMAWKLKLKKSVAYISDPANTGRFSPGHTSQWKGKNRKTIGRMAETQFKRGHLPHNTRKDGAISIRNSKGRPYMWIRLSLGVWDLYHRVVWEKTHGKIPPGHVIIFRDGDTMNVDISNLAMVTMKENMQRNSIHQYPPELIAKIRAVARLKKTIRNAKK